MQEEIFFLRLDLDSLSSANTPKKLSIRTHVYDSDILVKLVCLVYTKAQLNLKSIRIP